MLLSQNDSKKVRARTNNGLDFATKIFNIARTTLNHL